MKTLKYILTIFFIFGLASCTKDFVEINKNPNAVYPDEASARYFITNPEYQLYAPNRYPYWRAHLIHTDRYAGYFTFGFKGDWWSDELGYHYSSGYTDAAWGWLEGYFSQIDNFMRLTDKGGDFENPLMYAVGQIIKSLYYQTFTDVFGEVPFSEAGNPDIQQPKFDTQNDIYQGLIAMLDEAITTIGDNQRTGDGVQDLGENDVIFHGDLQKWKKLANTLKLRIAMRAYGASGADWVNDAVHSTFTLGAFLDDESDNALLPKDNEISQWGSACYGDIWWNFGLGSNWTMGKYLIDYMSKYNDPRLPKYAQPAPGGTFVLQRPKQSENEEGYDNFPARINFLRGVLEDATGGDITFTDWTDSVQISIPENKYYIGQPPRLNSKVYPYVVYEFWSTPSEWVIQKKNQGKPIFPEIILTTGESYFLRAEAVEKGLATGNAEELFQNGIRYAMKLWEVSDADIDDYLTNASLAHLDGTQEENLQKIEIQKWIAHYTDGFEGWADLRKNGYPVEMAQGVSDPIIFGLGDDNGVLPQRMRYGNAAYNNNGDNLQEAISRQGPDVQGTPLWWAKTSK